MEEIKPVAWQLQSKVEGRWKPVRTTHIHPCPAALRIAANHGERYINLYDEDAIQALRDESQRWRETSRFLAKMLPGAVISGLIQKLESK